MFILNESNSRCSRFLPNSLVALNREKIGVFLQKLRVLFIHSIHRSHARAVPQRLSERCQLVRVPDGVDLHAPVVQIPDEAADAQARRGSLGEEAEPNSLHPARDEKSLGLLFHGVASRAA